MVGPDDAQSGVQPFVRSMLEGISAPTAVVDPNGVVAAVNTAWERFGRENDCSMEPCGVGVSYRTWLDDPLDADARRAAAGVLAVIDGHEPSFQCVYPCHAPNEERWFRLVVAPLQVATPRPVVTMHVRLHDRHGAREYDARTVPDRVVCAWCADLERVVDGGWQPLSRPVGPDEAVSHGICPGCVERFDA